MVEFLKIKLNNELKDDQFEFLVAFGFMNNDNSFAYLLYRIQKLSIHFFIQLLCKIAYIYVMFI